MDSTTARKYVAALADRHTKELGFLPMQTIHDLVDAGRVLLSQANDDPVGYLIHGAYRKRFKIFQTCTQLDARRHTFASQTLATAIKQAQKNNVHVISLHCRIDLEANEFWKANGFHPAGERTRGSRTPRKQIRWERNLPAAAAHFQELNSDGHEATRLKQFAMMRSWGASQRQVDRFMRHRYA